MGFRGHWTHIWGWFAPFGRPKVDPRSAVISQVPGLGFDLETFAQKMFFNALYTKFDGMSRWSEYKNVDLQMTFGSLLTPYVSYTPGKVSFPAFLQQKEGSHSKNSTWPLNDLEGQAQGQIQGHHQMLHSICGNFRMESFFPTPLVSMLWTAKDQFNLILPTWPWNDL